MGSERGAALPPVSRGSKMLRFTSKETEQAANDKVFLFK